MNLNERAMLVSVNIFGWAARKYDKKISKEVADAHQASEHAGRYNKRLLPQVPASYKAVLAVERAAYDFHRTQTLPWFDTAYGQRILPVGNFMQYAEQLRAIRSKWEATVQTFLNEYPALREEAKVYLNGMFDPSDYPTVDEMRTKFRFNTATMPLPDGSDFRCSIGEDEVRAIRSQIEQNVHDACQDAMKDAWQRLADALKRMSDKLHIPIGSDGAIFRDSLFENLEELCDLLPRLNLYGTPAMDRITAQIREKILSHSPEIARQSDDRRAEIANEVDKITKAMSGLC